METRVAGFLTLRRPLLPTDMMTIHLIRARSCRNPDLGSGLCRDELVRGGGGAGEPGGGARVRDSAMQAVKRFGRRLGEDAQRERFGRRLRHALERSPAAAVERSARRAGRGIGLHRGRHGGDVDPDQAGGDDGGPVMSGCTVNDGGP